MTRNQKKVKLEDVKAAGSENVRSGELVVVKQKGSGMQSLPTMPWSFDGASQFTINSQGSKATVHINYNYVPSVCIFVTNVHACPSILISFWHPCYIASLLHWFWFLVTFYPGIV